MQPANLSPSKLSTFLPAGDLWTRLQRNFSRLEETKYYPQNLYQRAKEHEKWPGDTEGRTLLAWILLGRASRRPPRYLADTLALWPQETNPKGYIGKIYTDGISEQQLASHGWVLQAFAELSRAAEAGHDWASEYDARAMALPIIENLFLPTAGTYASYPTDPADRERGGSYSGSHLKQCGPWIISTDVGCFAIGMAGLIDACEAFGLEGRLAPLIDAMVGRFLAIDLAAIRAQTHATLTALRGLIRWARMTGNGDLWEEIASRYTLYTGLAWSETYSNYNWFGRPQWTEPCAVVDSLVVAMDLWRHTGDTLYLEHAQLIWFNAMGHGQRANGGFGCDNCPGADGENELKFSVPEAHWCCTMRGGEGLARMCQFQIFCGENNSLWIPFGLPGDFSDGGIRLHIEGAYPHAAEWTLANRGRDPLSLRFFVPPWVEGIDSSGGWLSVELSPGETKTLSGNMHETERELLPSTTAHNPEAAGGKTRMRGPLLFAKYGGEWKPIFEDYLAGNMSEENSAKTLILAACRP